MCVTNNVRRRPSFTGIARGGLAELLRKSDVAATDLANAANKATAEQVSSPAVPATAKGEQSPYPVAKKLMSRPIETVEPPVAMRLIHHCHHGDRKKDLTSPAESTLPCSLKGSELASTTMVQEHKKTACGAGVPVKKATHNTGRTAKNHQRHFVQHNYHDHSTESVHDPVTRVRTEDGWVVCGGEPEKRGSRGGVTTPFPLKLHSLLESVDEEDLAEIVSWQPHGRAFLVHDPKRFVKDVMPSHFRQTKLSSFQRQLNLYGFSRLTTGLDKGAYYHELFLRGRPFLCRRMARTRIKGTGVRTASSPETEPNFYAMPPVLPEGQDPHGEDCAVSSPKKGDCQWSTPTPSAEIPILLTQTEQPIAPLPPGGLRALAPAPSLAFLAPTPQVSYSLPSPAPAHPGAQTSSDPTLAADATIPSDVLSLLRNPSSSASWTEDDKLKDEDEELAFEGQTFHCIDPKPAEPKPVSLQAPTPPPPTSASKPTPPNPPACPSSSLVAPLQKMSFGADEKKDDGDGYDSDNVPGADALSTGSSETHSTVCSVELDRRKAGASASAGGGSNNKNDNMEENYYDFGDDEEEEALREFLSGIDLPLGGEDGDDMMEGIECDKSLGYLLDKIVE